MIAAAFRTIRRHVADFLLGDLSPRERGLRDARLVAGRASTELRERVDRARRHAGGRFARMLPSRRRYLDGLIYGIESELLRRTEARQARGGA